MLQISTKNVSDHDGTPKYRLPTLHNNQFGLRDVQNGPAICEVHTFVYLYIYCLVYVLVSRELVERPPSQHEEQSFLGGRLWLIYAEVNNS